MKKSAKILILFFIINLISCKEKVSQKSKIEEIDYYSDTDSKKIYKKIIHYINFDSVYVFYKNGNLFKKGKQYKENQKFGVWKLYDKKSNLREIREWYTIKGKSRANRIWNLNQKGDTISWRSKDSIFKQKEFFNDTTYFRNTNYDKIYFDKDTIKLNEPLLGVIEIGSRALADYPNNHARAFISRENKNFNYDFSNNNEVVLDTFNDLTIDKVNKKWFTAPESNEIILIEKYFNSPGKKIVRGFYEQYAKGPYVINNEIVDYVTNYRKYFQKIIIVEENPE